MSPIPCTGRNWFCSNWRHTYYYQQVVWTFLEDTAALFLSTERVLAVVAAWIASVHVVIRSLSPVKSFATGVTGKGLWPEVFPRGPPEALLTFVGCLPTIWSVSICLRFLTAQRNPLFTINSCLEHLLGMASYCLSNFKPALMAQHSDKGKISGCKIDFSMFTYGRQCTHSPSTFWPSGIASPLHIFYSALHCSREILSHACQAKNYKNIW